MLQHAPLCTRARRNFCARVPAAPDRAADRKAVRNAQFKMKLYEEKPLTGDNRLDIVHLIQNLTESSGIVITRYGMFSRFVWSG